MLPLNTWTSTLLHHIPSQILAFTPVLIIRTGFLFHFIQGSGPQGAWKKSVSPTNIVGDPCFKTFLDYISNDCSLLLAVHSVLQYIQHMPLFRPDPCKHWSIHGSGSSFFSQSWGLICHHHFLSKSPSDPHCCHIYIHYAVFHKHWVESSESVTSVCSLTSDLSVWRLNVTLMSSLSGESEPSHIN